MSRPPSLPGPFRECETSSERTRGPSPAECPKTADANCSRGHMEQRSVSLRVSCPAGRLGASGVRAIAGAPRLEQRVPHANRIHAAIGPADSARGPRPFSARCSCRHADGNGRSSCRAPGKAVPSAFARHSGALSKHRPGDCRSLAGRAASHGVHRGSSAAVPLPPGMMAPTIA